MADLETGLNIPVSAYADKNSAEKAVNDLTKGVLNSLKNGYIEVPAEVKASFNRGSKELDKAQKDVINQWEKMSKEGFSSSEEYLDDLIDKYKKFKSLAGREGKGNSKQTKWLTKTIGESLQPYLAQKRELENIISGFEKVNKSANKTSIKQHKTKTDRRYEGIEKVLPKGHKSDSGIDAGRTNEYEIRQSEVSSYPSHFARQMTKSANEAKKWENSSLKQEINKEKANKLAEEAFARGGNKRRLTPAEKAKGLSEDILKLLPELINKIRTSEDETEISELSEKFFATSKAIFTYSKEAGEEVYNAAKKEINTALAPFYSIKGKIGLTDGTDKSEASRDDKIESLLKGLLDRIEAKEEEIKQELIKLEQLDEKKDKSKNKASQINSFANRAINGENIISDSDVIQDTKISRKKKISENNVNDDGGSIKTAIEKSGLPALFREFKDGKWVVAGVKDLTSILSESRSFIDKTDYKKLRQQMATSEINAEYERLQKGTHSSQQRSSAVQLSQDLSIAYKSSKVLSAIKKAFGVVDTGPKASDIAKMSQEQIEKIRADRIAMFGLPRINMEGATGGKAQARYTKFLYGRKVPDENPFANLRLSEGINFNLNEITDALQSSIQKNMFGAQTGGIFKNLVGSMTGYIGMPSLEKSRAEVEGLNQVMANIRQIAQELLQQIKSNETDLRGLESKGDARFDTEGKLVSGTPEAEKLFVDLEDRKAALNGIIAELSMVNELVGSTKGNVTKIVQQLGFVSPELRQNNTIIQNLNAGLDKNGKALKFQTRTAEVLNYSFQLMARQIGRMWKNWMMMLNPINLIKKAFSNFAGWNTKWQRTLNVIKYNIHAILEPFMDKVAQFLVNVIGFVDIISMKIQRAFGNIPISLFDQAASDSQKIKEELEAATDVSAGFDELHDIGSNNTGANDLLGEIYKPNLPKSWEDFANKLADIFIKIGKVIKWCIDNWKLFLGLLAAFVITKSLLNLLGWAKALKGTLTAIGLTSFSGLLSALGIVAGSIITIKSLWDSIEWSKNWGGMLPEERQEQADKNVKTGKTGGTLLGAGIGLKAGGIPGAVIGGLIGNGMGEAAIGTFNTVISAWHGDEEGTEKAATKAGEGIGKTVGTVAGTAIGVKGAAAIGAVIGSSVGPIGTAVGAVLGAVVGFVAGGKIGEALGDLSGKLINKIQKVTRGVGEFQRLKVSLEDVNNAMQLSTEKTQAWNIEMNKLQYLEQITGENGQFLYNAIEMGSMSYDRLNESQKAVYDQYAIMMQAENDMQEAKKQSLEYSAKWEEQLAKESGDYTEYIAILQKGMEDGIISQEQMTNYFAQTYGKLSADAKQTFVEQLPAYLRESVQQQGQEYETFGNKIATIWTKIKTTVSEHVRNAVEIVKTRFHEMVEAVGIKMENLKTNLSEKWQRIKEDASLKWKSIKETVTGWAKNMWENVTGWFQSITDKAKQAWETVQGYFSNIKNAWNQEGLGGSVKAVFGKKYDVPFYEQGTNYVPNDGLAYLHQGEAVVPKKYNQPYQQGLSTEEKAYMYQMMTTMRSLDSTMKQGITVNGQFTQRGSDLVAVVNKTKSQTGSDLLSNVAYAR